MSGELYRILAEESSDILAIHDVDGTLRWISPAVERVLGWTPEQRLSQDVSIVLTDDLPLVARAREELLAGADTSTARVRLRHVNGTLRWADSTARAVRDVDGTITAIVASTRDVHDQVVAEQARAEAEKRYRLIAENAADVVLESVDGVFRWVSPSSETVLGWKPDELVGRAAWEYIHPDDLPAVARAAQLADEGQSVSGRARALCSDGSYRWLARTQRPVTDTSGAVVAHVTSLRDVEQQVEAERALAASEAQYRLLAEHSSDFTIRMVSDGLIDWVSPSVTGLLGWKPEDVVGRRAYEFLHPDEIENTEDAAASMVDGRRVSGRGRVLAADGTYRWTFQVASPVMNDQGEIVARVVAFQDIHAQVRAEQALAESERRFRLAMESAPTGIAVLDLDRQFVEVNSALCRMLHREEDWLVGRGIEDILDENDNDLDIRMRAQLLEGDGVSTTAEKRLERSDGSRIWVDHAIGLLRDDDGEPEGYVSQFVNVTEAREIREALHFLATHDPLTHLANRAELLTQLRAIGEFPRPGALTAVLFVDLDQMKSTNDNFGHLVGDAVLVEVANRLSSQMRADDVVSRLGGDEFVIVLPWVRSVDDARCVADKIHQALAEPLIVDGRMVDASVSIGIAIAPAGTDAKTILERADKALYGAKDSGGRSTEVYGVEREDGLST